MSNRISHYERARRLMHLAHQLREAAERELSLAIDAGEVSAPAVEVEPLVKLSSAQADAVHARAVAELRKIRAAIVEAEKQAAPIARELDEARIELARWRAHFGDVDAATSRRFAFGDGAGEVAR
ncbi:hypothetical protein ACWGPQ_07180 [Saccharomonospora azurea]